MIQSRWVFKLYGLHLIYRECLVAYPFVRCAWHMPVETVIRMYKFWQASLTRSVTVTVTLACAMSAFWLLSETISFYYRYSKAETEVRENLVWELNLVVVEENRRYELAQVRVNTLLRLWSELLRNARLSGTQSNELKHTVFVPFEGISVDEERAAVAGQVVEIFGDSDPVNRVETFLLVPGQGVFFYRPEGRSAVDMKLRMQALLSRQYHSTASGNYWGGACLRMVKATCVAL